MDSQDKFVNIQFDSKPQIDTGQKDINGDQNNVGSHLQSYNGQSISASMSQVND